MPRLLLASFLFSLAACSQTIGERVAEAAERINAQKPASIVSARAEGGKLVIHLAEKPSSKLTSDEMVRLASAGLCGFNEVRALVKQGGSIRIEAGTDFSVASTEVDRCPDS